VSLRLDSEAEKPRWDAPLNPCEARIAQRFGIANQNRPADKWLADTARWTWRVKSFLHLENELMGRCANARKPRRSRYSHAT